MVSAGALLLSPVATSASASTAAVPGSVSADPVGAWGPAYPVRFRPRSRYGELVSSQALARSTRRGTTLLHAVTLDYFGAGVVSYGRSAHAGASWSQRVRVSPRRHSADQPVVAAAGRWVYVAWVRRTTHREIYLRINHAYGAKSAWSPARRIGARSAFVASEISIAATGRSLYIAIPAAGRPHGGATVHARIWMSHDHASTWRSNRLATTMDDVRHFTPVAAHGSLVAVASTTDSGPLPSGRYPLRARVSISRDGGRHWSAPQVCGLGVPTSIAVLDGRIAVSWSSWDDDHPASWVRTWRRGTWQPARSAFGGLIQLRGSDEIGVAYVTSRPQTGTDGRLLGLMWRTSSDGGRSWNPAFEVRSAATIGTVTPWFVHSAVWRSTGAVHILSTVEVETYSDTTRSTEIRSRS